jgi:hypothetical protein
LFIDPAVRVLSVCRNYFALIFVRCQP